MSGRKKDEEVVKPMTEEERIAWEERRAARRWQYGHAGGAVDSGMGHMGGAGASGSVPDISHHSDERRR
jgi:hypothetical protein